MTALAYLSVVLIWSTTALGIRWGVDGFGFFQAAALRMLFTLPLAWLACRWFGVRLPQTAAARWTYLIGGMNLFVAMGLTYLGAQHVNSGLIAVLYGTGPLLTGLFSVLWLRQRLHWQHWAGLLLALCGLIEIHLRAFRGDTLFLYGALTVLAGAAAQAVTSVWIKRLDAAVPPLALTLGSLLVAVPLYALSWWLGDWPWPPQWPLRASLSLAYMVVFATLIAFSLYGYLLQRLKPVSVALIQLITPVTSLLLGHYLNQEPISMAVWLGTALIVLGLLVYQSPSLQQKK